MAHAFRFQLLCGSVYRNANLLFSPDGNVVYSAVGNRVSAFELTEHVSWTLPVETRRDIACMSLSPDGGLLLLVDKDGRALVVAMASRTVLHRINFKQRPRAVRFSPNGKLLAVAAGRHVQIWLAPPRERLITPMTLVRTLTGHFDDVVDVAWAPNSVHLLTASLDATARVHTARPVEGFVPVTLSGHRAPLVACSFPTSRVAHTVSADGAVYTWVWERRASVDRALLAGLSGAGKGTVTPAGLDDLLQAGLAKLGEEEDDGHDDEEDDDEEDGDEEDGDEEDDDEEDDDEAEEDEEDEEDEDEDDDDEEDDDEEDDDEAEEDDHGDEEGEDDDEEDEEDDDEEDGEDEEDDDEDEEDDDEEDDDEEDDQDASDDGKRARLMRTLGAAKSSSAVGARRTREKHVVPDPDGVGDDTDPAVAAAAASLSVAVGEWVLRGRHLFLQAEARVVSAAFGGGLLVAGFDTGLFSLFALGVGQDARAVAGLVQQAAPKPLQQLRAEAAAKGMDAPTAPAPGDFVQPATDAGLGTAGPDAATTATSQLAASTCEALQSLSVGSSPVTTAVLSPTGEWLALACAETGQLLVWEWQSETYVMKQRGHAHAINAVAWAPDGQAVATGGDDGKVKLWSARSGFCFATFAQHRAPVTGLCFVGGRGGRAQAVVASSLDGTVRAYDLARYRNFRTLVGPSARQFTCVHADPDGELVAAGSSDPFEICVWSMRTGKLLDVLAGHEGPVTAVQFAPESSLLASSSWDATVRVWDPAGSGGGAATETLRHGADVLDVSWRPDGKRLVATTRDGQLHFWDPQDGRQTGSVSARRDAAGGRLRGSSISAASADSARHFSSARYSADGGLVAAGGRTNFVCVYAAEERLLLRKFPLTHSRDIDGVLRLLNSGRLTDTGFSKDALDGGREAANAGEADDPALARKGRGTGLSAGASLPGVTRGGAASGLPGTARQVLRETRCRALAFSPAGSALAVAAVEGLMLFARDEAALFDPVDLSEEVTPQAARAAMNGGDAPRALVMALHLNDPSLTVEAAAAVDPRDALLAARAVPSRLVPRLLSFLAEPLRSSKHLELWIALALAVLATHASYLRAHPAAAAAPARAVLRAVLGHQQTLGRLAEENADTATFLASLPTSALTAADAAAAGWVDATAASDERASAEVEEQRVHEAALARLTPRQQEALRQRLFGRHLGSKSFGASSASSSSSSSWFNLETTANDDEEEEKEQAAQDATALEGLEAAWSDDD